MSTPPKQWSDCRTMAEADAYLADCRRTFVKAAEGLGVDPVQALHLWDYAAAAGKCHAAVWADVHLTKRIDAMRKLIPTLILAVVLALTGCADARSGGRPEAERVFMDQPGYACFLVRDEDGRAVGGNCIKE